MAAMNPDWTNVFLGVIAFATLMAAIAQVAVLIGVAKAAKRINVLADRAERAIEPTVHRIDELRAQVADVVARGAVQIERAERLVDDISHQAERVSTTLRGAATYPVRETSALVAGARAIIARLTNGRTSRGESDEPREAASDAAPADLGYTRPPVF